MPLYCAVRRRRLITTSASTTAVERGSEQRARPRRRPAEHAGRSARVEANAHAAPAPSARRAPSGTPRRATLARPSSALAPRITGSAGVPGESVCVAARESPRTCRGERRAAARDAGDQSHGLGETERQPIARAGVLARAGPRHGRRRSSSPRRPRSDAAAIERGPPRRRSINRRSASPAIAGGASAHAIIGATTPVEVQHPLQELPAHVDRQRDARRPRAARPRTTCAARGRALRSSSPRSQREQRRVRRG